MRRTLSLLALGLALLGSAAFAQVDADGDNGPAVCFTNSWDLKVIPTGRQCYEAEIYYNPGADK